VRAELGKQVGRHRHPGRAGDRGRAQPSGDAADPHQVRHDQVARLLLQDLVQLAWAVDVLPDLDRRPDLGGELRQAVDVVVDQRFLDPGQAEVVEGVAPAQRFPEVQALVEVGHDRDLVAHGVADGLDRGEVAGQFGAAEPHLDRGEVPFLAQFDRLVADSFRVTQPQAGAVVRLHRAGRPPEQLAQWPPGRLGQRVPRRHVQARSRDERLAFPADEVQEPAGLAVQFDRRDRVALQHRAEAVQGRDEVAHGVGGERLKIAAADDALVGGQVDENERPVGEGPDSGADRPLQLDHNGPGPEVPHGQGDHDG
jgi:hypothetical protein